VPTAIEAIPLTDESGEEKLSKTLYEELMYQMSENLKGQEGTSEKDPLKGLFYQKVLICR
jgi:hypothetical protein